MKKIISGILVFLISLNFMTPLASGLYITYFEKNIPITKNLTYKSYIGKDSSSYSQKVHLLDFDPKGDTLPIVGYGKSLLSHNTLKSMMETERKNGNTVVAGINGDFYSLQTGIPLSAVIRDGILLSTDSGNNAVGFKQDGAVIIGKPQIELKFSFEPVVEEISSEDVIEEQLNIEETPTEEILTEETPPQDIPIETSPEQEVDEPQPEAFEFATHYNKYPTPYSVYMVDTNYSSKTASTFSCREIVIKTDGQMKLNSTLEFEIVDIFEDSSNSPIPYGTMILCVPTSLRDYNKFATLKKGDVLTLTISADEQWSDVYTAIGGGDVIVQNGEFVPETVDEDHEKYRNVRSAVGIRENGTVFFVAVDGDGKNGMGMNFQRLAEFMIGEGAVTALNLDGGGSSTVAVSFPSESEIVVMNTPRDGSMRAISNSVLFLNNSQNNTYPELVDFSVSDGFFLGGTAYTLTPNFYNGQGGKSSAEYDSYEYVTSDADAVIENGVYVSADKSYVDRLHATFNFGEITVEGNAVINVTDTIDTLKLNKNSVMLKAGQTFNLTAVAERLGIPVITPLTALTFSDLSDTEYVSADADYLFENEYVTISKNGILTAREAPLFTKVDISVSYKDTKTVLSIYFGKRDEVLDSFDSGAWCDEIAASDKKALVKGFRSDKAIIALDGVVAYNTPKTFEVVPEYFTVWLKGEYIKDLYAIIQSGDKQEFLPYYIYKDYSDVSGWIQLISLLPQKLEGSIELLCPVVSQSGTAFTVDTISAHYGYITDPFEDITGIWSHDYITKMYDMGVVNGYTEDGKVIFKPENNITREEFAKMLACYLNLDTNRYSDYGSEFADAEQIAEWSAPYVKALSNEGYMNGKSNGDGTITFDAKSFITREETMHVFAKLLETDNDDYTLSFSDADTIQPWALESVKKVVKSGIITGFDDGTLRASAPVTRAQMCTMFTRLWDYKHK